MFKFQQINFTFCVQKKTENSTVLIKRTKQFADVATLISVLVYDFNIKKAKFLDASTRKKNTIHTKECFK